jgi:D-alanyl-D-alanine carboxypeptidase (penicillin-binding protein 5/6)
MRKITRGRLSRPVAALMGGSFLVLLAPGPAVARPGPAHSRPPAAPGSTIGGDLLAGHGLIAPAGVKAPPKTQASAYVVADADTGQVLAAKDPHGYYRPASTLKTLTAVTLIGKLDKRTKVKPSRAACNEEGSAVGLKPMRIYTVDDLFRALLMVSGNDAAVALAEANGGVAATLRDMNAEAHRLQADDTVAKTPNGLDKPGQRSSAYDLALIARAGLAKADFRRYIATKVADFPAPKNTTYQIQNHNKLLWRYKGMIGVKNGWTSKALGSFVGAAKRNGHTIIVVVMHHDGSFWNEVSDLLDWGFAVRATAQPVGRLVNPLPEATRPVGNPGAAAVAPARKVSGETPESGDRNVLPLLIGGGVLVAASGLGYGLRRRMRMR